MPNINTTTTTDFTETDRQDYLDTWGFLVEPDYGLEFEDRDDGVCDCELCTGELFSDDNAASWALIDAEFEEERIANLPSEEVRIARDLAAKAEYNSTVPSALAEAIYNAFKKNK